MPAAERSGRDVRVTPGAAAALVAALVAVGFYLRLRAAGQSLANDEIFLYSIVHGHGLGQAFDLVHDTESTPPLHFVLAWASERVGSSETWIRLPSVVLGTATVPLVYLLGLRTAGRPAGLVAAAIAALSPFAIFYGSEGRAYATLAFISVVSTLALLEATRTGRAWWWVAFALACTAALYTHYTAIFVVAAQIVWALAAAPGRRRAVVLSTAAIVLLYLPWIPSFLVQRKDSAEQRIEQFSASISNAFAHAFPGAPYASTGQLPGRAWMVLLGVVLAGAAVSLLLSGRLRHPGRQRDLILIGVVAIAAPLGAWLYTLGPTSIFLSRNLISSFPAFCVLLGALLTAVRPPRLGAVAVAATLLVVTVGTVKTFRDEFQRPAFRDAARYLNRTAAPGQPIVSQLEKLDARALRIYLDPAHPLVRGGPRYEAAWRGAARGRPALLIRAESGLFYGMPQLGGPDSRFVLRGNRRFSSAPPLLVGRYSGRFRASLDEEGGRRIIRWSLGPPLKVSADAARGHIDGISPAGAQTDVFGWATDPASRRPADWVLVFLDDRLLSVATPHQVRPDLIEAYGSSVASAGFRFVLDVDPAMRSRLSVFAVSGAGATELHPPS
jgi:hypothetical protein